MSTIQPFPAIRYATQPGATDISRLLAPPYDVLDESDKQALLAGDPRNFVGIDLPHIPPKNAGPDEVYLESRRRLDAWLGDGTMIREADPAIYAYHQRYRFAGTDYVRKMFFARLRLEPLGSGNVFPHERTFGGPKEDRLALTKAHEANLSPIFGLYPDEQNEVARTLEAALPESPVATGTLQGVENQMWTITDAAVVARVTELMATRPIFIADGHHRYGTAGLYRDWLTREKGSLAEDHPANYVLCVFCAMEDPGLLILPTHRVLAGVQVPFELLRNDERLDAAALNVASAEEVPTALGRFGPQAVALFSAAEDAYLMVRPNDPDLLDAMEPEHTDAWRRLGLAFLHACLIDRLIAPQLCAGNAPEIHYVKADQAAVDEARDTNGAAFLMQPTTMAEMRGVCQAGDLMPQKSTYFYPKLASGLVINPLTP